MSAGKYIMDKFGNLLQVEYGGDGKIERKTVIVERPSQLIINFEDPNFNIPAYETELRAELVWFAIKMENRLRDIDELKCINGWLSSENVCFIDLQNTLIQFNSAHARSFGFPDANEEVIRHAIDAANALLAIAFKASEALRAKPMHCGQPMEKIENGYRCNQCIIKAVDPEPTNTALMHKHTDSPPCPKCGSITLFLNQIYICNNYECENFDVDGNKSALNSNG